MGNYLYGTVPISEPEIIADPKTLVQREKVLTQIKDNSLNLKTSKPIEQVVQVEKVEQTKITLKPTFVPVKYTNPRSKINIRHRDDTPKSYCSTIREVR